MGWGYWLFVVLGVLAAVHLVRARMALRAEHRRPGSAAWVRAHGPLLLIVGLLIAYALAGHVARAFLIILLVAGILGPFIVTYTEKRVGAKQAHNARVIMFLVIAVCAAALALSFVVKLVLVLLAMVAIFVLLALAAVLLGLVRPRQ